MTGTPELRTDRLLLRGWRASDKAPYAALNGDPEVMRHFPSTLTPQQSDEMVDRMAAAWASRGFGLWAVELVEAVDASAATGLIGFVGLSSPTWGEHFTPCVEVGWRLARQAWGRGYAPEAARAAVAWGFAHLGDDLMPHREIVSFTTEANLPSRRVMEKLGMSHDPADDFDHPLLPEWAGRRHVLYRLPRP